MVEVSLPGKINAKSDQTLGFMQYIKNMYITIGQRCTYLNINGLLSSEIQSLNTIFCYKQNAEKPIYSESDSKM